MYLLPLFILGLPVVGKWPKCQLPHNRPKAEQKIMFQNFADFETSNGNGSTPYSDALHEFEAQMWFRDCVASVVRKQLRTV
eukprot:6179254-Amphidinium_carterae.1